MIAVWTFLRSGAGKIVALALLALGALGVARQSGKRAAKVERRMADLEAERKTRERMDNATPAKNVDDARANLSSFLHEDK